MWHDRRILDLLHIEHPILLAPMAGATNPPLVAAVSNAGGLGGYGAAAADPESLRAVIADIRERTTRPFNINLFAAATERFDRAARPGPRLAATLAAYHAELGLGPVPDPVPLFGPADEQLAVCLDAHVPVVSFHFGVDAATVRKCHAAGAAVLCTATTVAEARLLEAEGVDAVIAQGTEAGGHRGTFAGDYRHALIGTLALVPQVVDTVTVPVIAAGGIMDARGLVACLALGASAVQLGTAFLGCPEAPINDTWREALRTADDESTVVTEAFSGKPARAISNRYIEDVESLGELPLPYPAQYSVAGALRREAVRRGDARFIPMWAGQGVGLLRNDPAAQVVERLVSDSEHLLARLASA